MRKHLVLSLLILMPVLSLSQGFKKLSVKESGIDFINSIVEDDTLNGLSYLYLYNGGGVAIGDVNNDGLEDLYFTGNLVADRLYLNKGNLTFVDVTKKYFKDQRFDFHTGATMIDINNDGWLDIYVCAAGPAYDGEDRRNKLFINQKGKYFVDEAKEYGLDDSLNTTQAAFFDADNDGDLDVYLLNHIYLRKNTQYWFQFNKMRKVPGNDRLMINENGHFVDRTTAMGIRSTDYGQGVVVSDFNQDGWQDIYVCNDFDYGDKLFMNKGKDGFEEQIRSKVMHTSLFAMGVDAGDINNDGRMDIMTLDMANEDHVKSKKNMGGMSSKNFWNLVSLGQHYQYMFNALQLNVGEQFVDIAQLAHISKTDWSWAPLIADFDNDGYQDVYVSNGYLRDLRDNDFTRMYDRDIQISREFMPFEELKELIPTSKTPNYIFRNNGDLSFEKKNDEWGMEEAINVNGAAYADLDNDGDLDLICNASNAPSFILENQTKPTASYLKVQLIGINENKAAIGARVEIFSGSDYQVREVQPSRGFQSGMSTTVHFGLGKNSVVDSILVRMNGVVVARRTMVKPNQLISLELEKVVLPVTKSYAENAIILKKVDHPNLKLKHAELNYDDFEREVLLPHKMSQLGPFIQVDDINGDGLDDLYLGAARGSKGAMMIQKADGQFVENPVEQFKTNFLSEEMQSIFFDADNDGDKDLYIVMGSNEAEANDISYQDQLYLNDGHEKFRTAADRLPENHVSGQKVLVQDVNGDGWLDLVVFGRQVPGSYPAPANSMIWINEKGTFRDQTKELAPEFESLGMVTDAVFTNIDEDEEPEMIIVGEWMPITVFDWVEGQYQNITVEKGLSKTVGWWNTIALYSSEDGEQRYVLGNIGLNNKYHPSVENPLHIYMTDFDGNGTNDIVLAKAQDEILYPVRGRQCSSEQMPFIAQKFPTYNLFAIADVETIYTAEKLSSALHIEAHTFASSILTVENGVFSLAPLPNTYQTGPINAVVTGDFDGDHLTDMFCFGNKFEAEVETVRYDGNPSLFVSGKSGIEAPQMLGIIENTKSAAVITIQGAPHILLGVNNDFLKLYKIDL